MPCVPTPLECSRQPQEPLHQRREVRRAQARDRVPPAQRGEPCRAAPRVRPVRDVVERVREPVRVDLPTQHASAVSPLSHTQADARTAGLIHPTGVLFAASRASFTAVRIAAKIGVDADVPPVSV